MLYMKSYILKTKVSAVLLLFLFVIISGIYPVLSGCNNPASSGAILSYNSKKNEFEIRYKGIKIAEGSLYLFDTNLEDFPVEYRTENETDENGALIQRFIFTAKEQPGSMIKLTGHFQGDKAFPCSPERQDGFIEMIRAASGISKSRLNTGIYSPVYDWTLYFAGPADMEIEYDDKNNTTYSFSITKQDKNSITIVFKPDFYKLHLDHPYFNPGKAHLADTVPCGWISWKAYGGAINENNIKTMTDWCTSYLGDYGLEYIIIDDGWFTGQGPSGQMYNVPPGVDWTKANQKFPSGMKELAGYVHNHHLKIGIWISPFGFSGDPEKNPGYWIRTGAKGEFLYNEWHGYYYCDGSNSKAVEKWLTQGVQAQQENGIDLFKLDGMFHVAYEGYKDTGNFFTSKGLTWQEALRMGWDSLYDTARGSYVLSCWGRVPEIAGIPDAIRIGQDKDSEWIYITIVAEDLRKYFYEHNIIWCDDPDHIVFRDLSLAESRTWATLVGITGTLLTFSDRPETMSPEKLSIVRKILPVTGNPVVRPLHLFSYESPPLLWGLEITRDFDNWLVVANCGVDSSVNEISFQKIGLDPEEEYTVFDFWNLEFRGIYKNFFFCGRPPHHDSLVYAIKRLRPYPWVISVNRHISQGGVSIKNLEYRENILKGTIEVIKNDPYMLFIYTHGKKIEQVIIDSPASYVISVKGYCATLTITSPLTRDYIWEISFGENDPGIMPLDNEECNPALAAYLEEMQDIKKEGVIYLSDIHWKSSQNGWGPVEKNMSNGEAGEGDGNTLTIDGITFDRGLGTHAGSEIVYSLDRKYSRFKAMIGIDDETGFTGTVVFCVIADGLKLFDSGMIKGGDEPREVDVDITDMDELKLVVTDAGDGISCDHADWADARVVP
ncbi:MAG: NPCBM/NEW2 domain-containing protein [Spirochaetales bacterium]|nr:NPCBM/NEW2 domain-containing protein [Spirochaetales bacterium]